MKDPSETGGPAPGGDAVRRLEAVTDTALAHLSLDALLDELLVRVRALLGVDTASILLLEGDVLQTRAAKGLEEPVTDAVRVPLGAGFAGRVAAEQRPILVENATRAELVNPVLRQKGVRSLLGVPMLFEGKVIGVLQVGTIRRRRFGRADAQLLQIVADRIGLGIAYARLYEEERRARAEAEAERERTRFLSNVSALFSTSLDFEGTLGNLSQLLVPALADCCVIDVRGQGDTYRREHRCADPAKQALMDELAARYPPRPDRPADVAAAVRAGRAQLLPEVPASFWDGLAQDEAHRAALERLEYRSLIVVPLVARGQITGALTLLAGESGRRYEEADVAFAQELGWRAGLAVDNARLYHQAHEAHDQLIRQATRQEALADASRVFAEASLDLDGVLAAVARHLGERMGDVAAVRLLAPDGGWRPELALHHPDAHVAGVLRQLLARLPPPVGSVVIRTGRALLVPEVETGRLRDMLRPEFHAYLDAVPVRSLLAVPLRFQGRVTGVLAMCRLHAGRPYDAEDQALLQDLADRAALEVESARLYREAQEARAQTEAASRAKDEFLATVSHELRTPLTPILVWARLLARGGLDETTVRQAVDTIERSAKAQAQLVEDLLDVSRIIAGKLRLEVRPTRLASVVASALEPMRPAADAKGIRLETDLDADAGLVSGDADRLQQVVWNLISNAIKFTPPGGRVAISLRRTGAQIALVVRDSGKGITGGFLPHLFERFRQGDSSSTRAHGGLGLGLAIVRHLVELHGGTVAAASAGEGEGATFTVTLPALPAGVELTVSPPPGAGARLDDRLHGVRVLVVDDEADACVAVKAILEQDGAAVRCCTSAGDALAEIERWHPDVLMSDIGMPGEDGYSLIRKIRARPQDAAALPAIAITAYARADDRARALAAGFQMHLAKPIEPDELVAAIASVAGRRPAGRAVG